MHTIILVIIFVVIFINIIRAARKSSSPGSASRTNRRMWSETAFQLNLDLLPPNGTNPFPSMRGMTDGLYTEIWADFDTAGRMLIFCRVEYALNLPFQLCIVKGPMSTENAGSAFEIAGISSDDVSVTASESAALQKFLTQKNINTLKNCLGIYHAVKVTDSFIVLASTGINDAISFSSFIERASSAAKTLSGGHTVTRQPGEIKPIIPVEDSVELPFEQKKEKPAVNKSYISAIPEEEPPEEIVNTPENNIPQEQTITEPVIPQEQTITEPVIPQKQTITEPVIPQESPSEEPELDLTAQGIAAALFSASFPGEKEKAIFRNYEGKRVQWNGLLKSAYPYSSDFVFGKGPGTKATFEIAEVASGYGMKNKIKATVSLGEETLEILKGKNGTSFAFSGTVLKFEPFSKEILLSDGVLEQL